MHLYFLNLDRTTLEKIRIRAETILLFLLLESYIDYSVMTSCSCSNCQIYVQMSIFITQRI